MLKRLALGLICIALGFLLGWHFTGYWSYGLLVACFILVLLPPSWDPAIQIKERQSDDKCSTPRHETE